MSCDINGVHFFWSLLAVLSIIAVCGYLTGRIDGRLAENKKWMRLCQRPKEK